jgi:hypothetical protein
MMKLLHFWLAKEKFGGFNHHFYEKVFELLLRLKANYIWTTMGKCFYADDSLNIKTADKYGIVIGTSHHEPLMRAHDEWRRLVQDLGIMKLMQEIKNILEGRNEACIGMRKL